MLKKSKFHSLLWSLWRLEGQQNIVRLLSLFCVIEINLSEKTAIAKFPHKRTHAKNDNRCAISTKNELSVSKHPNILLLKRQEKKDVDMAETSYDLTITVKLLTVNRAHRLRKILYTKSKFHSFLWRLEGQPNIGHFLSLFSVSMCNQMVTSEIRE